MNIEILRSFRKKVNHNDMILHLYRNKSGRNQWSIICSAMDWIEVAIEGIDVSKLSRANDNQSSIKMMTFVSCIDVMWEAVQQLHRVLFDTDKIPFLNDYSVFGQNVTDNIFFKTIRSCFAAHPINLQKVYEDDLSEERWFASWSGGGFSDKDFSVILYSNVPEKGSRFFDISFSELYDFAEKRYMYLTVLSGQIDSIIDKYLVQYRNIPIKTSGDINSDVDVLLCENKQRLDNDYYNYELLKIKRVLGMEEQVSAKNEDLLKKYRDILRRELGEIEDKLQRMELGELENQIDADIPMEIQYPFSILSNMVWQGGYDVMLGYALKALKQFFSGIVELDDSMTADEIYVLACAASFKMKGEKTDT